MGRAGRGFSCTLTELLALFDRQWLLREWIDRRVRICTGSAGHSDKDFGGAPLCVIRKS